MNGYIVYCTAPREMSSNNEFEQCPHGYRKEALVNLEALQVKEGVLFQLESGAVTQTFGVGFAVVVMFFLAGRGIGEVLRLIRRG